MPRSTAAWLRASAAGTPSRRASRCRARVDVLADTPLQRTEVSQRGSEAWIQLEAALTGPSRLEARTCGRARSRSEVELIGAGVVRSVWSRRGHAPDNGIESASETRRAMSSWSGQIAHRGDGRCGTEPGFQTRSFDELRGGAQLITGTHELPMTTRSTSASAASAFRSGLRTEARSDHARPHDERCLLANDVAMHRAN